VRSGRFVDRICLKPSSVRVGYGSPPLLATLPPATARRLAGRAVWVSTPSPLFTVRGIRVGTALAAATDRLPHGIVLRGGGITWYLAPAGTVTAVLGIGRGAVQEVGIADRILTATAGERRALIADFQ
jgi:hypothetical protein